MDKKRKFIITANQRLNEKELITQRVMIHVCIGAKLRSREKWKNNF
jgi:hypothetical protein